MNTDRTARSTWTAGLAAAAGLIPIPALAAEPALTDDFLPARVIGHVYVNAATGERTVTPVTTQRLGGLFWQNDDAAGSCNFFYGQDRPTRDTALSGRAKFGSAVVHWGDLPRGSVVDGYDVAYAGNVSPDCEWEGEPVEGLDMINAFFNAYDGEVEPGGTSSSSIAAFVIEDLLPTPDPSACGWTVMFAPVWIYTIDLEGSGHEFAFGEEDLDGDGLADFGYSYEFVQGQTFAKGVIGPMLVRPASLGGQGTAAGCPDLFDWFNQPDGPTTFSQYVGPFWFGGGDCAVPRPYGSFLLNLYGISGDARCAAIDFNADGVVDFLDYLEFLNFFDGHHPAADLNQDGLIDFSDYLEFLNLFDLCSSPG